MGQVECGRTGNQRDTCADELRRRTSPSTARVPRALQPRHRHPISGHSENARSRTSYSAPDEARATHRIPGRPWDRSYPSHGDGTTKAQVTAMQSWSARPQRSVRCTSMQRTLHGRRPRKTRFPRSERFCLGIWVGRVGLEPKTVTRLTCGFLRDTDISSCFHPAESPSIRLQRIRCSVRCTGTRGTRSRVKHIRSRASRSTRCGAPLVTATLARHPRKGGYSTPRVTVGDQNLHRRDESDPAPSTGYWRRCGTHSPDPSARCRHRG